RRHHLDGHAARSGPRHETAGLSARRERSPPRCRPAGRAAPAGSCSEIGGQSPFEGGLSPNPMPLPASTVDALAAVVGRGRVLTQAEDLIPYSFDGTAALKQRPEAVVFPRTTAEVSDCVRLA